MARPWYDEELNPSDPWGRPPGHPFYGQPPDQEPLGGTPYGDPIDAGPPPTGGTPPPGGGTPPPGGGSGGGFDLGPLLQPYPGTFTPPAYGDAFRNLASLLGPAPEFSAPQLPTIQPFDYEPFSYGEFTPTTGEDVFGDPSFGFRKGIGEEALLNSRAAQGLARTGGTLKDLLSYNQNFASQEFGNVDQRRRQTYDTNRGNAFQNYGTNRANAFENWSANKDTSLGLYDRGFEAERAKFEPRLFEWTEKGRMGQRAEERASDDAFKRFQTDYDMWRNQNQDVFDRLKWSSEFGLDASTR